MIDDTAAHRHHITVTSPQIKTKGIIKRSGVSSRLISQTLVKKFKEISLEQLDKNSASSEGKK